MYINKYWNMNNDWNMKPHKRFLTPTPWLGKGIMHTPVGLLLTSVTVLGESGAGSVLRKTLKHCKCIELPAAQITRLAPDYSYSQTLQCKLSGFPRHRHLLTSDPLSTILYGVYWIPNNIPSSFAKVLLHLLRIIITIGIILKIWP